MNKAIAIDAVAKKMIVPVSKKLTSAVGMDEKTLYVAYFQDGLLVIGDPMDKLTSKVYAHVQKLGYDRGHEKGYIEGYEEGYNEGHMDGTEEGYVDGYRQGYDDAIEQRGYRNMRFYDCGVDCDYDCEHCRLKGK